MTEKKYSHPKREEWKGEPRAQTLNLAVPCPACEGLGWSQPFSPAAYSTCSLSLASSTSGLLLSSPMFHSPTASNILVSPLQLKLHLHNFMKWPLEASLQGIYPATCNPASMTD